MKKKLLAKSHKKLAKSQRKLKKAFKSLGQAGKQAENPAWMTALVAMASAVTAALTDRDKRERVAAVAGDVKEKAVGLLEQVKPKKEGEGPGIREVEKDLEEGELHLEDEEATTEAHDHV